MSHELSSEKEEICECCGNFKLCILYMLANCTAAWVCKECRKGS